MMTNERNDSNSADFWVKWGWTWPAAYQILLLIAFVLAWRSPHLSDFPPTQFKLLITVVTIAASAWAFGSNWYTSRRPEVWDERPLQINLPIIIVTIAFWFVLTSLHPVFNLILFVVYGQTFAMLPFWIGLTVALILSALNYFILYGFTVNNSGLSSFVLIVIFASLFSAWIYGIIRQSTGRRELLEQLQAAQAELAANEREAGRVAERERLSRDIHDTLAQGFTSIVMHLEAAEISGDGVQLPAHSAEHISIAKATARRSLQQAREVVADLRPDLLAQKNLPQALERTVVRWSEESGVSAEFIQTGDEHPLSTDMDVTLLRVTQESLGNIRKHAYATNVTVTLSYMKNTVMLDIQDDGCGIKQDEPTSGFGLQAMRERVAEHNGHFEIETEPEDGTTIVVTLPIA